MNIVISSDKTIAAIQQEFHEQFPFLKIEFFQADEGNAKLPERSKIPGDKTLSAYQANHHSENITITPLLTVAELEKKFLSLYGLSIQIFRKSGKAWLESTLTGNWTLQEQNEAGESLSRSRS